MYPSVQSGAIMYTIRSHLKLECLHCKPLIAREQKHWQQLLGSSSCSDSAQPFFLSKNWGASSKCAVMRITAWAFADKVIDFIFLLCLSGFRLTFPCIPVIGALEGGIGKRRVGNSDSHLSLAFSVSVLVATRRSRKAPTFLRILGPSVYAVILNTGSWPLLDFSWLDFSGLVSLDPSKVLTWARLEFLNPFKTKHF